MDTDSARFIELLKKPSAFLPLAMSLTVLLMLVVDLSLFGIVREVDEGAGAELS